MLGRRNACISDQTSVLHFSVLFSVGHPSQQLDQTPSQAANEKKLSYPSCSCSASRSQFLSRPKPNSPNLVFPGTGTRHVKTRPHRFISLRVTSGPTCPAGRPPVLELDAAARPEPSTQARNNKQALFLAGVAASLFCLSIAALRAALCLPRCLFVGPSSESGPPCELVLKSQRALEPS